MQAIDNTNLTGICRDCGLPGFVPVLTFAYDPDAETVTVTDGSTMPTGDTFKKIKVSAHSVKTGDEVRGVITTLAGNVVLDVSTLDVSKGLNLTAVILTTGLAAADGSAFDIAPAGSFGSWDAQKNS